MLEKVMKYIQCWEMVYKNDIIVVGVSGGADSVCLLFTLHQLKKSLGIELVAVHINHGLRGAEAQRDEEYVEELCKQYNIPLEIFHCNVKEYAATEKISIEEAGRKIRYEKFEEIILQYNAHKIAVAHHKNDNAETILINMFRGTGITGMTGIMPVRNNIIRPLLCCTREEIEQYLDENRILYYHDSTNSENEYTRNKIRNTILKYTVKEINHQAIEHINKLSLHLLEINEYINEQAKNEILKIKKVENGYYLEEGFIQQHIVIQKIVLRNIFMKLTSSLKDIEAVHLNQIIELFYNNVNKKTVLPYDLEAIRDYKGVIIKQKIIQKNKKQNEIGYEYEIGEEGIYYISEMSMEITTKLFKYEKIMNIPKNIYTKWFDYDKIKNSVLVRTRKSGDFISFKGVCGRKKIKNYMIDEKIPQLQRDSIPLIADGNNIMWVVGYRINEAYKVTDDTKNIFSITISKHNLLDIKDKTDHKEDSV